MLWRRGRNKKVLEEIGAIKPSEMPT